MSVLAFDFYAEDDPNGTLLGTLDDADCASMEFRVGLYDLGAGQFTISRHHASATAALLTENNLVKVRIPEVSATPIFAFWLKEGHFDLIHADEQGGEMLKFGGPGMLYILSHARLLHDVYAPTQTARGSSNVEGKWWWTGQPYGAIATRIIEEGQNQTGVPLADVTIDYDRDDDSDGTAWPIMSSEFEVEIGTDVLTVMDKLRASGSFVVIGNPDLSIQTHQSYGRNLTGAFGAGTVRFQKGVNILTGLVRDIGPTRRWTHVLQQDKDGNYFEREAAGFSLGDRAHWGYQRVEQTNDETLLDEIAAEHIDASATTAHDLQLEFTPGFDPANGRYMPGPAGSNGHVWPGDSITLHTGTGEHDYNAVAQPVTAIRVVLDDAADDSTADSSARSLHIVAELNVRTSTFGSDPVFGSEPRGASIGDIAAARQVADLSAAGANMVTNSGFENADTTGWSIGTGWTFGHDPAGGQEAFSASKVARLVRSGSAAGQLLTPFIAVDRNDDWWVSYWSFLRSKSSGTLRARVLQYNSGQTLISSSEVDIGVPSVAETAWTRYSVHLGPTPATGRVEFETGTEYIRVEFDDATTGTFTWDVDGVQVERGGLLTAYAPSPSELIDGQIVGPEIADLAIEGTHIADDAISTPKLQANSVEAGNIAAGAVETNKLAANAVVAGKIAAGAVTTVKLDAQAVTADKVAAGAITAEKVSVGGVPAGAGNAVRNPSFEDDDGAGFAAGWSAGLWSGSPGVAYARTTTSRSGGWAASIASTPTLRGSISSYAIPVKVGDVWHIAAAIGGQVASTDGLYVRAFFGTTDQFVTLADSRDIVANAPILLGWNNYKGYVTVPADVTWMRVVIYNYEPNSSNTLLIDDVVAERQAGGVQNSDGNVLINASGITVTNGKITVTNAGATVIIDGTSDMFRIAATGTLSRTWPTGAGTASSLVTLTGLGTFVVQPAVWQFVAPRTDSATQERFNGTYVQNAGSNVVLARAGSRLNGSSQLVVSMFVEQTDATFNGHTAEQRYFVLVQAAI